jgi:antitoxin component of MazEF toxin-antitoxin module
MYITGGKMPKITIVKEKNGQTKYKVNLPKDLMETLAVQKGDSLNLVGFMGDTITFKLVREK